MAGLGPAIDVFVDIFPNGDGIGNIAAALTTG